MKKGKIISIDSGRKGGENKNCKNKHIISKEKFVEILEQLKTAHDTETQISHLLCEIWEKLDCEFCESLESRVSHEETVVELLAFMMKDEYEDIRKYVYEMDFGRRETNSFSITLEGEIIYLDTAEELYDYLEKHYDE